MYDDLTKICYLANTDLEAEDILVHFKELKTNYYYTYFYNEPILKLNLGSREFCDCNTSIIFHQGSLSETGAWLAPDNTAYSFMVMDLGCIKEVTGVYLENLASEGRGTKTFQMYFYDNEGGKMTQIETFINSIEAYDAKSPSHIFVEFNSTIKAKFLVFQIISFHGKGGGLSFLEEYEALNPGNKYEY